MSTVRPPSPPVTDPPVGQSLLSLVVGVGLIAVALLAAMVRSCVG